MGTGWFGANAANVKPGNTVAVVGDGAARRSITLGLRQPSELTRVNGCRQSLRGVLPTDQAPGLERIGGARLSVDRRDVYTVNIPGPPRVRNKAAAVQIIEDFPLLVADLRRYAQPDARLLLLKANVCRLLATQLVQQGFIVLNGDLVIPFPTNGQQPKFRKMVRYMLGLQPMNTTPP